MTVAAKGKKASSGGTVIFLIGAVVFAAISGLFLWRLLAQRYSSEPTRPVVVAAREIGAGQALTAEDLRVAFWLRSSVPQGAFAAVQDVLQLRAVPLSAHLPGEPILAGHLSRPQAGLGIASKLEGRSRAISIRTESPVTLAQLLYPGARVDVLATLRRQGAGGQPGARTRVILQNIQVLAVGPDIDPVSVARREQPRAAGRSVLAAPAAREPTARHVVTLAVSSEQAEQLTLATHEGKIDLVLRSPSDREEVRTSGATTDQVLGETEAATAAAADGLTLGEDQAGQRGHRRRKELRRKAGAARAAPPPAKPSGPQIIRGAAERSRGDE